jgi:hypothetical protein
MAAPGTRCKVGDVYSLSEELITNIAALHYQIMAEISALMEPKKWLALMPFDDKL